MFIPDLGSGFFFHPGSQGPKKHQIPDPQHCMAQSFSVDTSNYPKLSVKGFSVGTITLRKLVDVNLARPVPVVVFIHALPSQCKGLFYTQIIQFAEKVE
jgi:hypothetical protein